MYRAAVFICLLVGMAVIFNSCKETEELPIVEFTRAATSITQSSAQTGGYVISEGTAPVTERGIVYGTSSNPTTANDVVKSGSGRGTFAATMTGLSVNTLYYVRAYAINEVGIAYAEEISFSTNPNPVAPTVTTDSIVSVGPTVAVIQSTVVDNGGSSVTARGVVYGTSQNPAFSDNVTNNGTGNGSFVSNLTGLTISTTYYVRAYAINDVDTSFGNELNFMTSELPEVTTNPVDSISFTTALSGGEVTSDGGSLVTERGVVYSPFQNPTISNIKVIDNNNGVGVFTSRLTGLTGGITYFIRAYATNSAGTVYGNEINFQTKPYEAPTVITTPHSAINFTTVTSGGNVTFGGGDIVSRRGVAYSTSPNPTIANDTTVNGSGTGMFTSNLTGLMDDTRYYVVAYAINSTGLVGYGDVDSFTTLKASPPIVQTIVPIANITTSSARVGGNVVSSGGVPVTARGIAYGTSPGVSVQDDTTFEGSGTGAFFSTLMGLSHGTTYYAKAYAINSAGVAYGNEETFTTDSLRKPEIITTAISSVTGTSAVSGGSIANDGGSPITARGVAYSTNPNPTIANVTTMDGTGTGIFTSILTGLTNNTTYFVRAYATNAVGTEYGNQVTFTTSQLPVVSTDPVTNVSITSATSGGNVTDDGGSQVTAKGVVYGKSSAPTLLNSVTVDGSGMGSFTSNLTGLLPNTVYFVRAYATSNAGTAFGNEFSFTTDTIKIPAVVTDSVTGVTPTSAFVWCNVTDDGGDMVTARGVVYDTTAAPTLLDNVTINGSGTGSYITSLTGLVSGKMYYVRSYATNSKGTAYGNEETFTTTP